MERRHIYILLLILIVAGFFRLYHITTIPPGLYPDEAMDGTNAQQVISSGNFSAQGGPASGWKVFYPENNGREGLFMNIQVFFLKFFGVNEPWVLRLPSTIFGILTVLGIYFLAKELFSYEIRSEYESTKKNNEVENEQNKNLSYIRNKFVFRSEAIGLLSAFFTATSFWHIMFSRISFRAIMAPFFLVWAIYLLLLAVRKLKEQNARQLPGNKFLCGLTPAVFWPVLAGGVIYGLGFYSYIAYRISPLLLLLFIPFFRKEKGFWKVFGTFLLVTFFTALPIGIYFLQHPADFMGRTSQVSIFASQSPLNDLALNTVKTLGMFNFAGDWNWRQNYAGAPELFWPVGILFLVGIFLSAKTSLRNCFYAVYKHFTCLLIFLWFVLTMLPVVISDEGIPHALRSILLIPPVMIFAGIGGVAVYDWLKKRIPDYWLRAVVAFFVAFIIANAYSMYFIKWAQNPNVPGAFAADYVAIGRQINALPASTPKYVIVQAGGVLVNGIPMPAQTVMFITDTFTPEGQKAKNVHYVLPDEEKNIPTGADIFYIK